MSKVTWDDREVEVVWRSHTTGVRHVQEWAGFQMKLLLADETLNVTMTEPRLV